MTPRERLSEKLFANGNACSFVELGAGATDVGISSAGFETLVAQIGAGFYGVGLRRTDSILILGKTSIHALALLIAGIEYGITVVPLNDNFDPASLTDIIGATAARACYLGTSVRAETLQVLTEQVPLIITEGEGSTALPGGLQFGHFLGEAHAVPTVARADDEVVLVAFSSGSTGKPKGITKTYRDLLLFCDYQDLHFRQFPDDDQGLVYASPFISALSMGHLGGVGPCLQALVMGRTMYLMDRFDPVAFIDTARESGCRFTLLTPTMYSALFKVLDMFGLQAPALRYCIAIGERCPPDLRDKVRRHFGATLFSNYGMSECFPGLGHALDDVVGGTARIGSCGKLLYGDLKLADDAGVDQGDYGELWVRNPTVRPCYMDDHLNRLKFVDGWYRTGDVFARDADGYLHYRGRTDEMFVFNGKNVYPAEIEGVFRGHADVEEACACGIEGESGSMFPALYLKVRRQIPPEELRRFYLGRGSAHTLPRYIHQSGDGHELKSGKMDRKTIKKILENGYMEEFKVKKSAEKHVINAE